jgi:hypothetical protein
MSGETGSSNSRRGFQAVSTEEFERSDREFERFTKRLSLRFVAYHMVLTMTFLGFVMPNCSSLLASVIAVATIAALVVSMLWGIDRICSRKARTLGLICERCGELLAGVETVKLCGVCPKCEHRVLDDAPYVKRAPGGPKSPRVSTRNPEPGTRGLSPSSPARSVRGIS